MRFFLDPVLNVKFCADIVLPEVVKLIIFLDERSNILTSYLEDLERRGPPPPPTASEPQRRSAKI